MPRSIKRNAKGVYWVANDKANVLSIVSLVLRLDKDGRVLETLTMSEGKVN